MTTEIISRFITENSKIASGEVHWRALIPDKTHNETSVFNITGLEDSEVWDIAAEHRPTTIARGDISIADVLIPPLTIVSAEPPPRHMAIREWPEKEVAKTLQMQLAARAKLVMRPAN